jgi:class 3 adenylate cyclase
MSLGQRYNSLEDFLTSTISHVDGQLDDGFGADFPVKGREIQATVLFADIAGFSRRTLQMSPAATLVYVQNFFAWITAEALHGRPGIVDKYIGDEVMVVFSDEFGSEDPLADAVQAAAAMSQRDAHAYRPHIGIASGRVIVGYAGTPLRYNASVFGAPVALAARCAGVKPLEQAGPGRVSSTIVLPATEWGSRELDEVIRPEHPRRFSLQPQRQVEMKGLGQVAVREIHNTSVWCPMQSAEDRAAEGLHVLYRANRYWPRWEEPAQPSPDPFSQVRMPADADPAGRQPGRK